VTGSISGSFSPQVFQFGRVLTGTRIDTSFTLTNIGDIDLLILGVENSTSNISVRCPDRFWILPDTSRKISFSFTSLDDKLERDTLILATNDSNRPEYTITLSATGEIDSLRIDFFKIETDSFPTVTVHFSVSDQANLPLEGLIKENFSLREDGIPIENFELVSQLAMPEDISAAIVIDRSGSMKGQAMRDAQNAANDLVGNLSANDHAMVMSFAGGVTQHTPFTSDKTTLAGAINSIRADGATALYTALIDAIDTLKNQPGNKAIIVLSDGQNNVGFYSPLDIVTRAIQHHITIFTIGLGNDIDESALEYIALSTGGRYLFAPTSEALSIIYRIISGNLQNNYVIRYQAPEEGLPIRTLVLTTNYLDLSASDTIQYCTEKQVISFVPGTPVFRMPEFYRNSKSYFYCLVDTKEHPLFENQAFSFIQDKSYILPCEGKYLGDSIFQFCVTFPEDLHISSLNFVFPDSILYFGNYIRLENKPPDFTTYVLKQAKTETIDVFAGGSLGVSLLAGAAGAGPSVAAAKAGVSGTAGMGLTFEMDSEGEERISRRFEAGIAEEVESPAINAGVGKIQAGAKAGISITGTLGQTMKFPKTPSSDDKKAKLLYLIETFSLGAISLSPDCSILKQALHLALSQLSGGTMSAYNRLYYSEMYGLTLEGTASVGASFALNKGSDQNKLNLAEVGAGLTFSGQFIDYKQSNDKTLEFGLAVNGGFSILELDILGLDLGSLYGYTLGADMTLGADFSSSKLNAVNLVFGLTENEQIVFSEKNKRRELGIAVPRPVITRALNDTTNMIASLLPFFDPGADKFDFDISRDHFLESAGDFFEYATGDIDTVPEHVLIDASQTETFCAEIGISAEIDAALIIGGGLELGVTLGYCEDETWPGKTYTVAEGRLLPLMEHGNPVDTDLLSLNDEIEFLFENVTNLVKDVINNLIDLAEKILNAGEEFAVSTYDEACTLAGQMMGSGGDAAESFWAKISSFNPGISIKNPFKSALLDPVIIQGYRSSRVSWPGKTGMDNGAANPDFLCLVSDCYRVKIYDKSDSLIETFDPLSLTIAINNEMLQKYGFGEEEKQLARIYYYNFDSLMWYEIPGDEHDSPDTITTQIERCGTYAAGILYNEVADTDAPEIRSWYPAQGETFDPDSIITFTYFEPPLGSGFDFSASGIRVDGEEVETTWDPVNNTLSFSPVVPLTAGTHTYEIYVSDKNQNTATNTVSFTVDETSLEEYKIQSSLMVHLYPNPASSYLNMELSNGNTESDYQLRIYNTKGQFIKQLTQCTRSSGRLETRWDLSDRNQTRVAAGIYFLRIKSGNEIAVRKVLVK
ncbi:MAG TPA: VWA domain-containing protein, partial [Prolixibacteraceae bacterium]|nr:VWA domain-containing protein [Prolixibacteraceae bacterium]